MSNYDPLETIKERWPYFIPVDWLGIMMYLNYPFAYRLMQKIIKLFVQCFYFLHRILLECSWSMKDITYLFLIFTCLQKKWNVSRVYVIWNDRNTIANFLRICSWRNSTLHYVCFTDQTFVSIFLLFRVAAQGRFRQLASGCSRYHEGRKDFFWRSLALTTQTTRTTQLKQLYQLKQSKQLKLFQQFYHFCRLPKLSLYRLFNNLRFT